MVAEKGLYRVVCYSFMKFVRERYLWFKFHLLNILWIEFDY